MINIIQRLHKAKNEYCTVRASVFKEIRNQDWVLVTDSQATYILSPRLVSYIKKKERFIEHYHRLDDFLLTFVGSYLSDEFWLQDILLLE